MKKKKSTPVLDTRAIARCWEGDMYAALLLQVESLFPDSNPCPHHNGTTLGLRQGSPLTMKKIKLENMSGVDRISNMPEEIIHHIMSHLSSIDIERFQFVSKRFSSLWSTFPIIDLDHHCLNQPSEYFLNYVDRHIRTRKHNCLGIQKFRLLAKNVNPKPDHRIDKAISFAIEKGVKELVLSVDSIDLPLRCYNMPNSVYYGKSITVLELHRFEFNPAVLIQNCPLIERLSLIRCVLSSDYKKDIKISSTKLESIKLEDCLAFVCIEIQASNLQSLEYRVSDRVWKKTLKTGVSDSRHQDFRIKVESCGSLRYLCLGGVDIRDWPVHHISQFPLLKVFSLRDCKTPKNMKVSTNNLEIFKLGGSSGRFVDVDTANCKFLKFLSLDGVRVTSKYLENCVSKLVFLENLEVINCTHLKHLNVSHDNLEFVKMVNLEALESIKIEAPKLLSFIFCGASELSLCDISISACKHIENLTLMNASITDEWLKDHLFKFPVLEKLELHVCNSLKNVEIFHEQLRSLSLLMCLNVVKVEVDTVELCSFAYSGKLVPFSLVSSTDLRNTKLSITSDVRSDEQFVMLRHLVGFFGHSKSFTLSCISEKDLIFPENLREELVPPLYGLRHMRIEIRRSYIDNNAELVDSLLWLIPHPDVLIIVAGSKEKFIKLHYGMNYSYKIDNGEKDQFCCRGPIKCWRHYLKMVEMSNFEDNGDNGITLQDYFRKNAKKLDTIKLEKHTG